MNERKIKRETERVVKKVLRLVESYETIGKEEFEAVLRKVIEHVHQNTGLSMQVIMQKTDKVIRDLPAEYGRLSEEVRSWEAIIAYLYTKYLRELSVLSLQKSP